MVTAGYICALHSMSTNLSQKRKYHSDDDSDSEELRLAKERVRRLEEKIRLKKLQRAKEKAEENVATLKEKLKLAELEFKTAAESVEDYERERADQRKLLDCESILVGQSITRRDGSADPTSNGSIPGSITSRANLILHLKRRRREYEKGRYVFHMNYPIWLILTYAQRNVDNQLVDLEKVDSSVGIDVSLKRVPEAKYASI